MSQIDFTHRISVNLGGGVEVHSSCLSIPTGKPIYSCWPPESSPNDNL